MIALQPIVAQKTVIISFFNSHCAPCKREIPELQKLQNELGASVKIILIASDRDKAAVSQFVAGMNLSLDILWDKFSDSSNEFQIKAYPSLFILDRQGKIMLKIIGYKEDTIQKIKDTLKQ